MILKNRVIWSDNGVLKDLSTALNNHISGDETIALTPTEDYLFFGSSEAPFNHRWMEVKTANSLACVVSISIWSGTKWIDVAETIDLTAVSGKTLAKSGIISWVPDKDEVPWIQDDTDNITGLTSVNIYDHYWVRLKFTGTFSALTTLSYIGHKFASDEDLYSLYPEFNSTRMKTRFESGITTYDRMHFESAKAIVRDLKQTQVINSENQILEWEVLRLPAVHKCAELIYGSLGPDWEKQLQESRIRYKEALKVDLFAVDLNKNASIDPKELNARTGQLQR